MAMNRRYMKSVSITHLVLAFFFLGAFIADWFVYNQRDSFYLSQWQRTWNKMIAYVLIFFLIILVGILGLKASSSARPSRTLIDALLSTSIGCAVLLTVIAAMHVNRGSYYSGLAAFSFHIEHVVPELIMPLANILLCMVEIILTIASAASCRGYGDDYNLPQRYLDTAVYPQGQQNPMMMQQMRGQIPNYPTQQRARIQPMMLP